VAFLPGSRNERFLPSTRFKSVHSTFFRSFAPFCCFPPAWSKLHFFYNSLSSLLASFLFRPRPPPLSNRGTLLPNHIHPPTSPRPPPTLSHSTPRRRPVFFSAALFLSFAWRSLSLARLFPPEWLDVAQFMRRLGMGWGKPLFNSQTPLRPHRHPFIVPSPFTAARAGVYPPDVLFFLSRSTPVPDILVLCSRCTKCSCYTTPRPDPSLGPFRPLPTYS